MGKRERENPCGVCGHFHKVEEGEVCGICGHREKEKTEVTGLRLGGAFPSEIIPEFLYLGSYDNASRAEILKTQGITRILNTVPTCQNLYRNSFTYHCLNDGQILPFNEASDYIEQCRVEKARVLVHCMSGQSRSPAIVIAYLMRHKKWRLAESFQWVKERRPTINLSTAAMSQLQQYEVEVFGSNATSTPFATNSPVFGYDPNTLLPSVPSTVFSPSPFSVGNGLPNNSGGFVFSATRDELQVSTNGLSNATATPVDNTMDST